MTHINNLDGILAQGLLSHANDYQQVDISNKAVNQRRNKIEPIYSKNIHEYVPFYFNARNAMLYANRGKDVIILGFNTRIISTKGAVFTDGNASRNDTYFSNDTDFLMELNWDHVFSQRWCNYGQSDEHIKSSMMSELLIPDNVSINDLDVVFCRTEEQKNYILATYVLNDIEVIVEPSLFF